MTSMVLGDTTLDSLIPSMNAPLKDLHGCSCRFILLLYQRTGRARAVWTLWTWTSPWARSTRAWVCSALPCPALFTVPCPIIDFCEDSMPQQQAFHVIFPCPNNGHLGIHSSWNRHSIHCVKHSKVFHFVFECTSLQGQADLFGQLKEPSMDQMQQTTFSHLNLKAFHALQWGRLVRPTGLP
jgi:hypothetical protein